MLTFLHPWMFALLPLPWLLWRWLPGPATPDVAVRVPFGNRIRVAVERGPTVRKITRRWGAQLIAGSIWALVLLALARPQWLEPPVSRTQPTRDLLLLVDLSGSMGHEDFIDERGETVDRLSAVKEVLGDFLVKRKGDRVGLVVFGTAPFLQSPFSTDLDLTRTLLDETAVGMAGPRTAFGDAIGLGIGLFDKSETPAKTIIALTDGNDTGSRVPPQEAARIAYDKDIRIHAVAMGNPETVGEEKLDEQTLKDVARAAEGSYFFAADRDSLANIYSELDRIETRQVNETSFRPRRDLYFWPVLAAVLLSLLDKSVRTLSAAGRSNLRSASGRVRVDPITGELEVAA